ncbi:MAG: hypothetical protein KQH79_16700 [Bacteroidetes bacterium]|nr:hypothetical protein [Bacteroidota bacterium]
MKQIYILIVFLMFLVIFSSCNSKYSTQVVAVDRIDTSGIYFSYTYLEKNYTGHFGLNEIAEDFSTSDSLKIKIEKDQPDRYEFISVVKRVWKTENAIVSTVKNNESGVYSYHDVDQKPLFADADNEFENDSLIFDYVKRQSNSSNEFTKVRVYILINETGKVTLKNAMTNNKDELVSIKKIVEKFPDFTPAINNNENVTVSYLIEIPIAK